MSERDIRALKVVLVIVALVVTVVLVSNVVQGADRDNQQAIEQLDR
jgi:hypothetical protein